MPTLHHQMFYISPVLRCFRKCAKMRTFESERVIHVITCMWFISMAMCVGGESTVGKGVAIV